MSQAASFVGPGWQMPMGDKPFLDNFPGEPAYRAIAFLRQCRESIANFIGRPERDLVASSDAIHSPRVRPAYQGQFASRSDRDANPLGGLLNRLFGVLCSDGEPLSALPMLPQMNMRRAFERNRIIPAFAAEPAVPKLNRTHALELSQPLPRAGSDPDLVWTIGVTDDVDVAAQCFLSLCSKASRISFSTQLVTLRVSASAARFIRSVIPAGSLKPSRSGLLPVVSVGVTVAFFLVDTDSSRTYNSVHSLSTDVRETISG